MALTATILANIRANYPSFLDEYENRIKSTGLLTSVLEMQASPNSIVSQDVRNRAIDSQGRPIQIPVLQDGDVTLTTTRTCTVPSAENDSALVNVTWSTVVGNITMTPAQYGINSIGYEADLNMKIQRMVEKMNTTVESNLETQIDNAKSQVYGATSLVAASGAKYPLVGGAIRVSSAQQELFFNDIDPINLADDFNTSIYKIVANYGTMPTIREWINQGPDNSNNRRFQFESNRNWSSGAYDFGFSNGISNGTGVRGTGYIIPDGAIGFLTRVDNDALNNRFTTTGSTYSVETLPGLQWPVGLRFKSDCADKSAIAGGATAHLTATVEEQWQFSFDYAVLTPYNSDLATRANPIRKFEYLAS